MEGEEVDAEELVSDYLSNPRLKPRTRADYGRTLNRVFLPWLRESNLTLAQVDQRVLNRWVVHLQEHGGSQKAKLSPDTVQTYAACVNHFLVWCRKEGELQGESKARAPKPDRRLLEVLTRGEIQRMEDAASAERDKLIIRTLADTGIRLDELLTMRASSIRRVGQEAYVRVFGKFGKERDVPISGGLARRLTRYAERGRPDADTERLWVTLRRRKGLEFLPLRSRAVELMLKAAAEAARIEKRVYPHLLRHSYATWRLQRGANPISLQGDMGHANLNMISQVYSHLSPSDRYTEYMKALRAEEED
jgi:site-specific recombinase XerD